MTCRYKVELFQLGGIKAGLQPLIFCDILCVFSTQTGTHLGSSSSRCFARKRYNPICASENPNPLNPPYGRAQVRRLRPG